MAKKNQKELRVPSYFQIVTVKEKKKKLSFTGYWILPDEVSVSVNSREKPKIPPKPLPPKYILPPCKSELEKLMDRGGGRDDWCSRLKEQLDSMEIEYIEHNDFY